MRFLLLLLAVPFLAASDCGNKENKKEEAVKKDTATIPSCVQKLIDDAYRESPPTPPIRVEEYSYKGKKVYLFTADCCDFYNIVYDDSCKRICAPSGGFTGGGDGKCPDFDSTAKLVKEVWRQKDR